MEYPNMLQFRSVKIVFKLLLFCTFLPFLVFYILLLGLLGWFIASVYGLYVGSSSVQRWVRYSSASKFTRPILIFLAKMISLFLLQIFGSQGFHHVLFSNSLEVGEPNRGVFGEWNDNDGFVQKDVGETLDDDNISKDMLSVSELDGNSDDAAAAAGSISLDEVEAEAVENPLTSVEANFRESNHDLQLLHMIDQMPNNSLKHSYRPDSNSLPGNDIEVEPYFNLHATEQQRFKKQRSSSVSFYSCNCSRCLDFKLYWSRRRTDYYVKDELQTRSLSHIDLTNRQLNVCEACNDLYTTTPMQFPELLEFWRKKEQSQFPELK